MSEPYKFKTQFDFEVFATDDLENDLSISVASLENLKPLIPKGIDLDRNIDLVGAAFNAAIVNRFNRNGDGIDSATAKDLIDYFVHKPTNIEHKKQKVVGHIVNAAFTDMDNEKILNTDKELFTAEQYKDAMNSHLGYEQTERTSFNWIKKLMVLGVIKRVKKNQYEPLWETLEDTISS